MKYIKEFHKIDGAQNPSDYTIFKIRYYADGINVRKGKFDGDDKQHWERAKEYNSFFWKMIEKVTNQNFDYWCIHYNGIGSKADPETHFGFTDKTINDIVKFINAFGFKFQSKDFSFIDKYLDTYVNEDVKLTPLTGNQKVLVVNNSKPQESRYLHNILRFLKMRGIEYVVATNDEDVKRISEQENIVGAILTGSEYRLTNPMDKSESLASKKALEILKCPIIGICYGMQVMAKFHGGHVKDSGKLVQSMKKLTYCDSSCTLFEGVDLDNEFSFNFNDIVTKSPGDFKVICKVGNIITGISNDSKKRYGVLFHPEDIERTFKVLDNFTDMFHNGQKEQDALKQGKFQYLESFKSFNMNHIKLFEHFNEKDKWLDLLKELTAKTTPAGFEINVEPIILRYGFQKDENGNYFKLNPKSKVLFTAHADNYCSKEEEVTHVVDYGKLETDGTTILGGDNKVGICYLISLIEAGKDYNYYIFKSEEIGRVGSKLLLEKNKEFLENIDIAFAIDRKGTSEIITTQYGSPCCSRETAEELKSEFAKYGIKLDISEDGGRCDTYTFRDVVRECVNISDGVFGEHTLGEYVDLEYFYNMIDTLKRIDFDKISINRIPSDAIEKINFKKLKDVLVVSPDLNLNILKLQTDNKEPDYINCYFKINNKEDYKAVFYKDLSLRFGKIVKVNYVSKDVLKKDSKLKDVKFKKVKPNPLSQDVKTLILEKIHEFIISKFITK